MSCPNPQPSTPPQLAWRAHWQATIPQLQTLSRELAALREGTDVAIMRSSQLDAARLDEELTGMLREQFMKMFALFQPGVIASLQAELALLLDLLVFWFSIRQGKPLPGMALMNLRFRDERAVLPLSYRLTPEAATTTTIGGSSSGGSQGALPAPQQLTSLSQLRSAQWTGQPGAAAASAAPALSLGARLGSQDTPQPGFTTTAPALESSLASLPPGVVIGGGRSGVEGPGLTAWQRGLYCLGAVGLKYAWGRLTHRAAVRHWGDCDPGSWRQAGWVLLRRAESGYRLASLLNLLVFLRGGKYRSLLERLLRARLVYAQPSAARAISFEYLNRQLVWHELSELLLFLLPLLDVGAIKRLLRAHLPRLPTLAAKASAAGAPGAEDGATAPCGICGTSDILSPWSARPCDHRFCYYCLRSHCLADTSYTCPICLVKVEAMQRCGTIPDG